MYFQTELSVYAFVFIFESYHSREKKSTKKYAVGGTLSFPGGRTPQSGSQDQSLLRMILPLMVFGNSVRNSTILGYL